MWNLQQVKDQVVSPQKTPLEPELLKLIQPGTNIYNRMLYIEFHYFALRYI